MYYNIEMTHGTDITTTHIIQAKSLMELGMLIREELIDTEILIDGGAYAPLTKMVIELVQACGYCGDDRHEEVDCPNVKR